MLRYIYLLIICCLLYHCDDPSLDSQSDNQDQIIEPIDDLKQLASIQVASDTPNNITRNITFDYDNNNLIRTISDSSAVIQTIQATYTNNERLNNLQVNINTTTLQDTDVSYGYDTLNAAATINLIYTDQSNMIINTQLVTDSQNRFNKQLTTQTDISGATIVLDNQQMLYSSNSNILRINKINPAGVLQEYVTYTYDYNINPFTDMNDVFRIYLFNTFSPYSRYMPSSMSVYNLTSGTPVLIQSVNYDYTLDTDGYPSSRTVTNVDASGSSQYYEYFNYR